MDPALEEGQVPLAPALIPPEPVQHHVLRWKALLFFFLLADFVAAPVFWLSPYSFDLSTCWNEQVSNWSFGSSLADWLFICMIRDFVMLVFIVVGGQERKVADEKELTIMRSAQPLRRASAGILLLGIFRVTLVDWSISHTSRLEPVAVFITLTSILAVVLAYIMRGSLDRADKAAKVEADLVAESLQTMGTKVEAADDGTGDQYQSSLSYMQMVKVMKPYFWPSSGSAREIRWHRFLAITTWVCVIGSKSANIISPLFLQRATNCVAAALKAGDPVLTSGIVSNLICYAILGLLSKSLKELQSIVYIPVQRAAYIEIAFGTFVHLHSLSLDWHLKKKMGNVIRSLQRGLQAAQQVMQYIFLYLVPTIAEGIAVVLIFMFHFNNLPLAIFVCLNLLAYGYVTCKVTVWRKKFRSDMAKRDNQMNDRLTDSLVNYETIKYFTAEEYESREYRTTVAQFQQGSMATQASMNMLNVMQQVIIYFTLAGGMLMSTQRMLEDDQELGVFVAVQVYILNVFGPLSFLGTIYNMAINALIDMYSFGQLLAEGSDVQDQPRAAPLDLSVKKTVKNEQRIDVPMVEFKEVSFAYKNQPHMRSVKNISCSMPRGGLTALVGSTGAGKTTLTRLLFRFYDPVAGNIFFNGQNLRSVTQKSVRAAIGMVPQDVVLFNDTIRHNLHYGRVGEASQEEIERAAESAQLTEFIEQQPLKYETLVGERGLKLSGGEKQRLAIARCLVKNPPMVVLDEATSALDSATEQRVQQALTVLSQSRTVLAIAHRLSTIKNYDQILVLESGEIVEKGTHAELVQQEGSRYGGMWKRQAAGIMEEDGGAASSAEGAKGGVGLAETA